jgi:predicted O-methyltransferase YrrM
LTARKAWRRANDLERLAQLRQDVHDTLGRLLTQLYQMAQTDHNCRDYWQELARIWEAQHVEALQHIDEMIDTAARINPARNQEQTVTVGDIHASGDVTITVIRDSSNVAAGKQIEQEHNEHSRNQAGPEERQ